MNLKAMLLAAAALAAPISASAQVYISEGLLFLSPSVGYRFSPYLAAELGAFQAKEQTQSSSAGVPVAGGVNMTERQEKWNVSGFRLAAVGSVPVWGDLYAIGRVGVYRMRGTFEDRSSTTFRSPTPGASAALGSTAEKRYEERTEGAIGIGAEWRLNKHLGIRALYEEVKSDLSFSGAVRMSTVDVTITF